MSPRKPRFDVRQMGRQILTVYLVLFGLNVLSYAVLVRPRARSYSELKAASEPTRDRLRQREGEVGAKEAFLAGLDLAKKEMERLRREVLSTRDRRMIEVQLEVARIAREFGINYKQVRYDNKKLPDEGLDAMTMIVPLEGGYANLRKFLQAVESSDKFLVIEQVALAQGHEGGAILQLNIALATYFDDPEGRAFQDARRRASKRA
jgi:Tfp pilus assembly protein PilO